MCTKPGDVQLTAWELDVVTKVFRSFETGLREATIYSKVSYFVIILFLIIPMRGSPTSHEDAWPEPHGAGDN